MPHCSKLSVAFERNNKVVGSAVQVDSTFWLHWKSDEKPVDLIHLSSFAYIPVVSYHTVPHLSVVLIYIWIFSSCHENLTKWSNNHVKPRNCLPLEREQINRAHASSSNWIRFGMDSYFLRLLIWRLSMTLF